MLDCFHPQALKSHDRSTKPLYVSVGHRISLEVAVRLTHHCCRFRVPEPIRQVWGLGVGVGTDIATQSHLGWVPRPLAREPAGASGALEASMSSRGCLRVFAPVPASTLLSSCTGTSSAGSRAPCLFKAITSQARSGGMALVTGSHRVVLSLC